MIRKKEPNAVLSTSCNRVLTVLDKIQDFILKSMTDGKGFSHFGEKQLGTFVKIPSSFSFS